MINLAHRELRQLTRAAIDLDKAIAAYANAAQAEAAAIYHRTGRPIAFEAESWRQQVRTILGQRRQIAGAFK